MSGSVPAYRKDEGMSSKFQKKLRRTGRKVGRFFKRTTASASRSAGRGLYFGFQSLRRWILRLSGRTVMAAGSALAFVLVSAVALAIALPESGAEAAQASLEQSAFAVSENLPSPTPTLEPLSALPEMVSAEGEPSAYPGEEEPLESITAQDAVPFTPVEKGDDGEIIKTIQKRLMELGYMDSDEPTEHFGSMTEHALEAFQRHNDLAADGICGESTYQLLLSDDAKTYVMQLGDEGDDVEGVQQRLYELGYISKKDNITGTFGEITSAAVKEFQKENDEKADGKVGTKTMEALYGENPVAKTFNRGDEDPIILACQKALKKLGYITFTPDGEMGSATVAAIKDFQDDNGLIRDGTIGPATRDLLLSGDASPKVMQLGDSGSDVEAAQKRLAKLKYLSSGNVTGYFGEKTEEAVRAFQKRNKLGVDGKIGSVTLDTLNSSNARKASSSSSSSSSGSSSSGSSSSGSSSSGSSSSGSSSNQNKPASNSKGVAKLIELAESKIGCKYVRGAKGPNTFDCSGFVYWCLKNAGVNASYMTSGQWAKTSKYQRISSMSSLQKGDILVFSGDGATGHVGIYIGSGKMIDASSSAGVVRKSSTVLKSGGYWQKHWICAYRVF